MKLYPYLFAFLLLTACNRGTPGEAGPSQILLDLSNNERFFNADQLAARMIEKDPSLRLVDVRNPEDFRAFSLPGAYNIPLSDLLKPDNQDILDCGRYIIVFFSNDDLISGKAWQLSRRKGCRSSFILQGGLNEWTRRFLAPPEPSPTATAAELEQYRFRKAVCQYFIGASDALQPEAFPEIVRQPQAGPKQSIDVQPKPQKAQARSEEGC